MKPRTLLIIVVLVLVALWGGYRWLKSPQHAMPPSSMSAHKVRAPLYQCPMHPQYTSDKPGDCPICGMRLVKVNLDDSSEPATPAHEHGALPQVEESSKTPTCRSKGNSDCPNEQAASAKTTPAKRKILYYADAMNQSLHFDKPGKASDGMDLIPVYEDEVAAPASAPVPGYAPVKVSPEQRTSMGIILDEARVMPLDRTIQTVGKVSYDETRLFHIHTKFDAYIEDLYVNFIGQAVKQGDPLFSVYSPELFSTENEYLLAQRGKRQSANLQNGEISPGSELVAAAKQRLELWDVGPEEIARLEKTGKASTTIVIRSPVNGYVTAMTARHGMRIMPADTVYDIADLSTVWVLADIYEMDLPFVHTGQSAQVTLSAEPGKARNTTIAYIDPTLDPKTRTVKVRFQLDNSNGDLKPEMFADVVIKSNLGTGLVVPDSAVLWSGERKIVFVQRSDGVFDPREVTTGVKIQNYYEIKQGLSAGDKVVTGANFLLDSESKLKASVSEMTGGHKH